METHENDPTTETQTDPWNTFNDRFGSLADQIKDTYRRVSSDDGPSADDIREAFGTLAGAWDQVAESVSSALQDPEVRDRLKDAAASFATAVGNTVSELGNELRRDAPPADEEE